MAQPYDVPAPNYNVPLPTPGQPQLPQQAQQPAQVSGQSQDVQDLIQRLGPQGLAQILGMGALDDQHDMLATQMDQAQALRKPVEQQYGYGAAGSAIADGLNAYRSARDTKQTKEDQKQNAADKTAARSRFASALFPQGDGQPAPAGGALDPFSF